MPLRSQTHPRFVTKDAAGQPNGYLVPIYNAHDGFFAPDRQPQQVYLTVVAAGRTKGPHLHFVRTGFFTCVRGNVKIVVRTEAGYEEHWSGEDHEYRSVEVPTGVPALLVNPGPGDAFVLNMPCPAWTPEMNDEHTADFSDYGPP
jgi:dTDP-4-dehydrorhamnose 3,5-epimerase-like enzyme